MSAVRFCPWALFTENVAAVKLVNRPPFFDKFAATIRHEQTAIERSRTIYIYNFTARPRWIKFLLEPVMNFMMKREVKNRLQALKRSIEANRESCT